MESRTNCCAEISGRPSTSEEWSACLLVLGTTAQSRWTRDESELPGTGPGEPDWIALGRLYWEAQRKGDVDTMTHAFLFAALRRILRAVVKRCCADAGSVSARDPQCPLLYPICGSSFQFESARWVDMTVRRRQERWAIKLVEVNSSILEDRAMYIYLGDTEPAQRFLGETSTAGPRCPSQRCSAPASRRRTLQCCMPDRCAHREGQLRAVAY